MSKLINASICYSDLMDLAKKPHSAFSRSEKNHKAYVNIQIWINNEPDKFGNDVSLMLNSKQASREVEGKVYIGNGKWSTFGQSEPKKDSQDVFKEPIKADDLPF
jgi:hypothetical protein